MGVYYISYTGVLTGSRELRMYNEQKAKGDMYSGNLSKFGKFCKEYDNSKGGKANEPFFDSIMAQIAITNDKDFNDNFKYVPVTPKTYRKGANNTRLNNENLKIYPGGGGVTFKLQLGHTKKTNNKNIILERDARYANGEHIFILGPISNETFKHIQNKVKNKNSNLFIHLQGENGVVDKDGKDISEKSVGMTPHPGMFNNAFNLQSNLYNAIRFRKLMREDASSYTVCMKGNDKSVSLGKFRGDGDYYLPGIMKTFYDNIITKYIKGSLNNNKVYKNLNITYITQDLYDKDNFVSLDQIVRASKINPEIHLVGRAFFNRPGFEPLNIMGNVGNFTKKPPMMFPGFKSLQFINGHNAAGAQNNNKLLTNRFTYNNKLSNNINDFIVDSWKKCSPTLQQALNSKKSTVDFMNQKSNMNTNHKPIGFHENMFVNVVGFWLYALYDKANISKTTVFNLFSKNKNTFNRALQYRINPKINNSSFNAPNNKPPIRINK